MNGKKFTKILSSAVIALMFIIPRSEAVTLTSTFDVSLEGWTGTRAVIDYVAIGGNPGGFLRAIDLPRNSFIQAPGKFLGDLSVFDGGTLSFDIKVLSTDLPPAGAGGNVTLRSGSTAVTTNVIDVPSLPVPSAWTSGSVALKFETWGIDQSTWRALLSNVTAIEIVVDPSLGGANNMDISGFDNFRIQSVPVPSLSYTPVIPCRIADTRNTSAGIIDASTQRNFNVYGSGATISAQGGDPDGCPSPLDEPHAVHINMVAVSPTGKGNLQAFPVGAGTGAGLSVNYNTIDTNLANAGTIKTVTGSGPDISVASNFSSAHTVIDVLGYYYPDEGFYYTPVDPCRIVDTRKTLAGIIGTSTQRDFRVFGPVADQGGNPVGCPSTLGVSPEAAHLNMIAVDPTGKGNLQAFPVGAATGAGLSVNYNTIDTNLANAGTVKTIIGSGPDISVASNFSSAHTVIDVLGYYSEEEDLLYTPVTPCRIVDTRKTSAGIIDANTQRDFRVFGPVGVQGGNSSGCSAPIGEPLAAHINMIAVDPTGKGNLQAFPVGAGTGAGLSVNYNTIDTNLANAGTVRTVTSSGPDITVASNFSSAHAVIDVLGYYYPAP